MTLRYDATCEVCGFTGSYASPAMAARVLRVHSCALHLARAASQQRRLQRAAAVDRTPKACQHPNTTHVHGTHACYVLDRCRCIPCMRANTAYESERTRLKAYGRWNGLVDAEPAREHVLGLMARGMGLKRISSASGVSSGSLSKLIYGVYDSAGQKVREPAQRILPRNADRLLAVRLDLADGARVDGTGTRRRLRALVALGYPISRLGGEIGVQNIHRTIHDDGLVVKSTADAAAALYERLSMTLNQPTGKAQRAAATRARNYAHAQRWLPPLAWDDDQLDNPDHQPLVEPRSLIHDDQLDEAAIYRRMHGDKTVRLSKADAAEVVTRCFAAGWGWNDIEKRTGVKPDRYVESAKANHLRERRAG